MADSTTTAPSSRCPYVRRATCRCPDPTKPPRSRYRRRAYCPSWFRTWASSPRAGSYQSVGPHQRRSRSRVRRATDGTASCRRSSSTARRRPASSRRARWRRSTSRSCPLSMRTRKRGSTPRWRMAGTSTRPMTMLRPPSSSSVSRMSGSRSRKRPSRRTSRSASISR